MASRKSRPKVHNKPAITITRIAYAASELVYLAHANKPIRYEHGDSRIAYIGTTMTGIRRVATSAAVRAEVLLSRKGVHTLEFYLIAAPRRRGHTTYRKLERALLLRFRERYGSVPAANKQGKRMRWRDDDAVFTQASINKILDDFAQ
jgi:hypothetical protein